ncbi:MAG: hypothetical protein AB8G99_13570 [Planctomycetaceae bacterium]
MFDFLVSGKQKRAQAMLANRVNKKCMEDVQGQERLASRLSDVHAMLVIPAEGRTWQFENAVSMLGSDISASGMCLLHSGGQFSGDVLVEMQNEGGYHYVRAAVKYCESLGYNYRRIGVEAKEVVHLNSKQTSVLESRRAAFAAEEETAGTAE